jgi:cation diffusion facilitator CzcD-associated flavoprotein CzcO
MSQGGPDIDERDRKDYFTPSSDLFEAHCDGVAQRYGIRDGLIKQEQVASIEYDEISRFVEDDVSEHFSTDIEKVFRVTTDMGVHFARIVVLAVGPGNAPSIPRIPGLQSCSLHEGYCHSMQIKSFPPAHMTIKIKNKAATNMLIVGGGLTSVQLADLAIKRGVDKVWLLMRGPVKVKYFDIELDWVGKFRNVNQAAFWSADTDEGEYRVIGECKQQLI